MQKTILIVEDDFLVAMDLQLMLESHGWQVMGPAGSVESALRLIEDGLPTAAVLDVNLGSQMVTPVAGALTASGVPFVLASSYEKPEQFGGDALAGAPNVGKPIVEQRLLAALAGLQT